MRRFERRLRLATGLIIACFVVGHFLNHSLGVVSIDAMDRLRAVLSAWWRSAPGTVLLYGSLLTHFALALVSLYRRTTLRMPAWEAAQLVLGLAVPPLLIAHIVGTRFYWLLLGHHINYERMVGVLWSDSWTALRQAILLLIVWTHFCFGMHYWLRLQRWYASAQPALFAAALLIPAMALAGFAAAGNELWPAIERIGGIRKYNLDLAGMKPQERARMLAWREELELAFWSLLAATLLARWLRTRLGGTYQLRHALGRVITAPIGRSILEALRATNGYYAQFRGDGLLALYGLSSELPEACRQAMRGAEALSRNLSADLTEPLRIGIGAHAGVAIVGTMGPPEAPIYSAIGDNINIAARFEGMTKAYSCVMVVSADTLAHAGLDPRGAPVHRVKVRGRSERVTVYAVADPRQLFNA